MILVTGATGNVGSEVVGALAAGGAEVRALSRKPDARGFPAGVDVVEGDLGAPETLGAAVDGVRRAFLLGGFDTLPAVLGRLRSAGVEQVVLLTSRCVVGGRPDNAVTRMWLDSEAAVRASDIPWTILRPSGFQSNALRWNDQLAQGDVVRAPWPDVPIAAIDPADVAAVAAAVLVDGSHRQAALSLSGPAPLTPGQQVAVLAEVLERPLAYGPLADHEARAQMQADTPADVVEGVFRFFSRGEFDDSAVVDTVPQVAGRPATTFEQWVADHARLFEGPS